MKKTSFLIIVICLIAITKQMHAQVLEQGNISFTAGYGFPNLLGAVFNTYESEAGYDASSVGPLYIKAEYAVSDKVGFGLNFAWAKTNISYLLPEFDNNGDPINYSAKINRSTFSFLARINYHFGHFDKFDPYFGGGLGYRNAKWSFTDDDPYTDVTEDIPNLVPFGFEFTLGARYFFTDNIGVYAEFGLAKSPIQGGLSLKF